MLTKLLLSWHTELPESCLPVLSAPSVCLAKHSCNYPLYIYIFLQYIYLYNLYRQKRRIFLFGPIQPDFENCGCLWNCSCRRETHVRQYWICVCINICPNTCTHLENTALSCRSINLSHVSAKKHQHKRPLLDFSYPRYNSSGVEPLT